MDSKQIKAALIFVGLVVVMFLVVNYISQHKDVEEASYEDDHTTASLKTKMYNEMVEVHGAIDLSKADMRFTYQFEELLKGDKLVVFKGDLIDVVKNNESSVLTFSTDLARHVLVDDNALILKLQCDAEQTSYVIKNIAKDEFEEFGETYIVAADLTAVSKVDLKLVSDESDPNNPWVKMAATNIEPARVFVASGKCVETKRVVEEIF